MGFSLKSGMRPSESHALIDDWIPRCRVGHQFRTPDGTVPLRIPQPPARHPPCCSGGRPTRLCCGSARGGPRLSSAGRRFPGTGPSVSCTGQKNSCSGWNFSCTGISPSCSKRTFSCIGFFLSCSRRSFSGTGKPFWSRRIFFSCRGFSFSCTGKMFSCIGFSLSCPGK